MRTHLSTEELALALLLTPGIGSRSVSRFLLWAQGRDAPAPQWLGLDARVLTAELPDALRSLVKPLADPDEVQIDRAQRLSARVRESGGLALAVTDSDYPDDLRIGLGSDAPPIVWTVGDLDLLTSERGAVVGSRQPSEEGVAIAVACSEWMAGRRACVVSGGAQGIDSVAHDAAIRRNGRTIVVLPQGLLTYRVSQALAEAIDDGRAIVLSQFAPDARWSTGGAIERNATVVALSRMVCVVEPRETGGSIRTARTALEQAVPVFVHWPRIGGATASVLESIREAHPLLTPDSELDVEGLADGWERGVSRTSNQQPLF